MARPEVPTIAILASGSGTTAEYVVHATQTGVLRARVGLVITNDPSARVLHRMQRLGYQYGDPIEGKIITGRTHPGGPGQKGEQTLEESARIAELCKEFGLVALLGYMKKVRGPLLDLSVVNTHPGPLPETAGCIGAQAQQRVLDLGLTHSAQTLHWVNAEYDEGEVIAAHEVPVMPGDTANTLFEAVQSTEKSWVPYDLDNLLHR